MIATFTGGPEIRVALLSCEKPGAMDADGPYSPMRILDASLAKWQLKEISRTLQPRLFHTPTFEEQGKSVVILGAISHAESVALLSKILVHPDKYMRLLAVDSLRRCGHPDAPLVLRCFERDLDSDVRDAASDALKAIATDPAKPSE